jgi:DNA-binding MarR family transcriptional regulator
MTDRTARTLPQELGILVKETQSLLHQRMDEALRPLGLSVPQYACLQNLYDSPGITGSELARRTFVSRQSMNILLQGLLRRGLVERSGEPGPRGELAVTLTDPAAALLHQAAHRVSDIVSRMTADLNHEQRCQLRHALTACRDSLAAAGT